MTVLTKERANKVYDILVEFGGASETQREDFVFYHTMHNSGRNDYNEWRFIGLLGYGGKYYSLENKVDCYKEDATPERKMIIKHINKKLIVWTDK